MVAKTEKFLNKSGNSHDSPNAWGLSISCWNAQPGWHWDTLWTEAGRSTSARGVVVGVVRAWRVTCTQTFRERDSPVSTAGAATARESSYVLDSGILE